MELADRCSIPMNDYEDGTGFQTPCAGTPTTDNIYQSLRSPNKTSIQRQAKPQNRMQWKTFVSPLLLFNALLLIIILVIVGVHYSHFTGVLSSKNGDFRQNEEVWHLHHNGFYLFWQSVGDCLAADSFCQQNNATLTTLQPHNTVWLLARARGQQLWVLELRDTTDGSADGATEDDSENNADCALLTGDPTQPSMRPEHMKSQGWVCERKASPPHVSGNQ
ncbi:uncharacterized protein [Salmo salar]|uniref:Uncharacterized protein n=1 Tax=Salmo salar TaxID=8030 RepID=A0A1S3RL13_SALSA|nr:uncharacterized protein LOC106603618 [Salmo salar]|eukprot:XP_014052975.1 PREDICTED: uncharacterized protein LOC106603618 [Salmo salar]